MTNHDRQHRQQIGGAALASLLAGVLLVLVFFAVPGCSSDQVESASRQVDRLAVATTQAIPVVSSVAHTAEDLGTPGAGIVRTVAELTGIAATWWLTQRRGKRQVLQLVKSIDAVLPEPTDAQKLAMKSEQDKDLQIKVKTIKAG
jgi:hypothetical protein